MITVGHVYPEAQPRARWPRRGAVLYVGSSNHSNRHGLQSFIVHAWSKIRNACGEAMLEIVGDVRPTDTDTYEGVAYLGRVDDEELARRYQAAHVVINPQVTGTGLKIKCVEALSAGCPLVVNEAGADGLGDGAGKAFWMAHNWDEFAQHVVTLLQNDVVRLSLESEARRFAEERFSRAAVFGEFAKLLDEHLDKS